MIISQDAVERFERRAAEVRAALRRARETGAEVVSDAYLEDFLARHRGRLLRMIVEALGRQPVTIDARLMDEGTPASRTADNLAAMMLLASKPAAAMTAADRTVLLRYKGWGGLSIEKVKDAFPPSLQIDEVSLLHEYYTPWATALEIARAIRPLLGGLVGADGMIRALEPSAGIGRFLLALDAAGAPPIRWTAVELSALSAAIVAAVRPAAEVFTSSFEAWAARHAPEYVGRLNLVIANPPFGTRGIFKGQDPDRSYREDAAWAYFLRRGLDLLAAGGLGVFIIPSGFMTDPKRKGIRRKVLLRHHLLSAFRLPSYIRTPDGRKRPHFPGASNIVDLVLFRRRVGELFEVDPDDVGILEGSYFEAVPGHVLGEIESGYRTEVVGPPVRLPPLVERPICVACKIRTTAGVAPKRATKVKEDDADEPRLALARALAPRIDAYLAALSGARSDDPHLLWPELSAALRAFVAQHGSPYEPKNLRALASERDVMRSFTRAFEPGGELLAGLRERPAKRTVRVTASDPLQLAEHLYRAERGLTLARLMQEHEGPESAEQVRELLLRAGWCVDGPGLQQLVPGEVYLTGDLWAKFDRVAAHPDDPQAAEQVRRLRATIRPALLHDLGGYTVRESWIPLELLSAWISETIGAGYPPPTLHRVDGLVQVVGLGYHELDATPRLSPETISLIGWLNHDLIFWKPGREKLESLSEARVRRAEAWDRLFRDWVRGAPGRSSTLMEAYNRHHRGFVVPSYSEEPLAIARWTRDAAKQLKGYQCAGIRRILENRGGLLAWDVGMGKTFTAAGAIAAARQEGWVQRPVVVVPNNIILQWRDEIAAVLPDYRVVLIGANPSLVDRDGKLDEESETDSPAERAHKWARFQAGEYDLALLTYSSMPRTRLAVESLATVIRETPALARPIALKVRTILDKKPEDRTEREMAVVSGDIGAWLVDKLELQERWEYDGEVFWEDLGVDFLVIDEIHNFKNLFMPEPREHGVPAFMGSPGEGAGRAWQLFFRAMSVRRKTGGGGILGLSATPAKNGPIELYSVISYINPRAWIDLKIFDAENFVDEFCVLQTQPIVTAAMRLEDRQAMVGFRRLRELQAILRRFLDLRSASEMAREGRLKKPKATAELVMVALDERQRAKTGAYVGEYRARMASGMSGSYHLGLITRLGLVAIHPNLDEGYSWTTALEGGPGEDGKSLPKVADYSSPKFRAVTERIVAQSQCGHIVFLEVLAGQVWLRETLVQAGIPRARIALLNAEAAPSAADRRKIAAAFNRGEYIVVIANAVAGEGANLQRRTCAVHNVDIPWDPMTRRQRNGRADRQGNENEALIIYDYVCRRSGDGPRLEKLRGKSHWIEEVLESRDDVALNPMAQVSVSPIELLAELTEDAGETAELLRRAEEERRARARSRLLRQVAALVRSADARFRTAERAGDPLEAGRLREEGRAEIEALRKVDAAIWPFFEQARAIERGPVLVSEDGALFWDGLRVFSQRGATVRHVEFGRIEDGRIGQRWSGEATWTSVGTEALGELRLMPASYASGWPEETEATSVAIAAALERLGRMGTWEDLGWTLASERFLETWWPRFEATVREQLARRTWSGRDELYPAIAADGTLTLAGPSGLAGVRLFAPGAAGFERFVELVRGSRIKITELRVVARLWWERSLPAGVKAETKAAEAAAASSAAAGAAASTPASEGAAASSAAVPSVTEDRASAPSVPAEGSVASSGRAPVAADAGHLYRIGDGWYGDTALIQAFGKDYELSHAGFGFFSALLPEGKIDFDIHTDERLFEDQSGRLHRLWPRGKVDLKAVLDGMLGRGLLVLGGEWAEWPTSFPPRKGPILAEVDPPAEEEPAPAEEVEEDAELKAEESPLVESASGLHFTIEARELQGAVGLIRRASVLSDEQLGLVELECEGYVIARLGNRVEQVELRFESTRCVTKGRATVSVRALSEAVKSLGKGVVTVRKAQDEAYVRLGAGGREVSIPTRGYSPVAPTEPRVHVLSVAGDVLADLLARTTYAMAGASREDLGVLHLAGQEGRLSLVATDGHRLAIASIATPSAGPLNDLRITASAAERLAALVEEARKVSRPRGRKAAGKAAPMVQIEVAAPGRPRALIVRTELFTFVAAHTGTRFPAYQRHVPDPAAIELVCVVARRELIEALRAGAKGQVEIEFGAPLVLRITPADAGQAMMSATVSEVFFEGPRRTMNLRVPLLLPALEALTTNYVALAGGTDPLKPVIVTQWSGETLPRQRREALAPVREAIESGNLAVVAVMR